MTKCYALIYPRVVRICLFFVVLFPRFDVEPNNIACLYTHSHIIAVSDDVHGKLYQ